MIRSLKKALQPSANDVAVTFELPNNYQVKMVPEKIPSIFNGEKIVIYGFLIENSEQKREGLKCKATLTGSILEKEFKFDVPFELTGGQSEEDVSVIHQLAVKRMIQEWQDDEEPYEQKHKKEIIRLSTDASVVSRYTAYIAVDVAQNKPVSGSMQSYELTANAGMYDVAMGGMFIPPAPGTFSFGGGPPPSFGINARSFSSVPPPPPPAAISLSLSPPLGGMGGGVTPMGAMQRSSIPTRRAMGGGMPTLLSSNIRNESFPAPVNQRSSMYSSTFGMKSTSSPAKQTGVNFIVSLQQANGSWLLSDQLGGVVSKSVEQLKSCCPVSCDDIVMATIWATLVVIELLKKKYVSRLEELELVIMKAEQWVGKQLLPSGVKVSTLKESASKLF